MFTIPLLITALVVGLVLGYCLGRDNLSPDYHIPAHVYAELKPGDTVRSRHFGDCTVLEPPRNALHCRVISDRLGDTVTLDQCGILYRLHRQTSRP